MACWKGVCRRGRWADAENEAQAGKEPTVSKEVKFNLAKEDGGIFYRSEGTEPEKEAEPVTKEDSGLLSQGSEGTEPEKEAEPLVARLPKRTSRRCSTSCDMPTFYDLEGNELGSGAFSTVFLATNRLSGQNCAVKTLEKKESTCQYETELMKSMKHPNICQLIETFASINYVYLILEHCCGGEMFDRIVQNGSVSEAQVSVLVGQITSTLEYMHGQSVCHRDLKPDNFIFLSVGPIESTPLKLIDFGFARRFKEGEVLTTCIGTALYVAPEVIKQSYGPACDMWSCGVIMYCLLCGCLPFDGATPKDILKKVRKGKYSLDGSIWAPVSENGKRLIQRLLVTDPERRPSASQVAQDEWISMKAPDAPGETLGQQVISNLEAFTLENRRARKQLTKQREKEQERVICGSPEKVMGA